MGALLLFTDSDGAKIVIERIKLKLQELNDNNFSRKYKVSLGLKIGAVEYQAGTIENPLDFIVQSKKTAGVRRVGKLKNQQFHYQPLYGWR